MMSRLRAFYRHISMDSWLFVKYTEAEKKRRQFANDILKFIFQNKNFRLWSEISLKYVPWLNMSALAQIMACRPTGDKPLSEPMHRKHISS